jgi:hypothetical protein
MAHFAELDENNTVLRVIVVNNTDCLDQNGHESEAVGAQFCHNLLGGTWKQTSYNGNFRKRYAGIGYVYNAEHDAFVTPQPYPSWALDADANWQAPTPMPTDGKMYNWNEDTQSWDEAVQP